MRAISCTGFLKTVRRASRSSLRKASLRSPGAASGGEDRGGAAEESTRQENAERIVGNKRGWTKFSRVRAVAREARVFRPSQGSCLREALAGTLQQCMPAGAKYLHPFRLLGGSARGGYQTTRHRESIGASHKLRDILFTDCKK